MHLTSQIASSYFIADLGLFNEKSFLCGENFVNVSDTAELINIPPSHSIPDSTLVVFESSPALSSSVQCFISFLNVSSILA